MSQAILFDMDGVLFDSAPFHYASWVQLAEEEGIQGIDERWFAGVFGRAGRDILPTLYNRELSEAEIERLNQRKEFLYREAARHHVKPPTGLLPLMDSLLENGWKIGIGSSGPRENVEMIIEELGLQKRVGAWVCADDVRHGKPDPEIFLRTAERLATPPDRCVVVEDAVVGIQAARAAGMRCVAITTTHPADALRLADCIIHSFENLSVADLHRLLNGKVGPSYAKGRRPT